MSDALLTDLYELTMMAGYHADGRAEEPATFDVFFRRPPAGVDLVVAAGLDPVLDYLETLAFTDDDLSYLASQGVFARDFLDWLADFSFTGDVWAVPEGVPVFGEEPLLRVTAPLAQAQLVETALLNRLCYSSLVASHAVTVTAAARGKAVLEFGARRAHGPDGALTASRAAIVGGCSATSNVAAGQRFGVRTSGTMAHSWIMSYERELEAFRSYARAFPDSCVLLVDTYDTLGSGVPNAITVGKELAEQGHELTGIRLDSGDLGTLARQSRRMLDEAGLKQASILVSGDLDASRIAELEEEGAPVDGYGVGTLLVTGGRDPALQGVYKLAEIDGDPVLKVSGSPDKTTSPGVKQVWRQADGDVIGLADEDHPGQPLLLEAMHQGRRLLGPVPVDELRERCREAVPPVRALLQAGQWSVRRSTRLEEMRTDMVARIRAGER